MAKEKLKDDKLTDEPNVDIESSDVETSIDDAKKIEAVNLESTKNINLKEKVTVEQKAELKLQKKLEKENQKIENKKILEDLKEGYKEHSKNLKDKEYIKKQKVKKIRKKFDFKKASKEAPIKIIKEVNKITWPKKEVLAMKFMWVIIFIVLFGLFFWAIDEGLTALFVALKILG